MASGYGKFAHGGVTYPLVEATTNGLLRDADPALFYAIAFIAGVLRIHVGPRLAAEAALHGLVIADAVKLSIHVEPSPVMNADQLVFPCLALYRKEDAWDEHTAIYDKDVSTWELSYILPPLTPAQVIALQPILRSAAVTIRNRLKQGYDPQYNGGQLVSAVAPIHKARLTKVSYGGYQNIDRLSQYYRAIVGTIVVWERDMPIDDASAWPLMTGVDASVDLTERDGTKVADFVQARTDPAPTITNVTPSSGTKAGGTSITVLGTGFRPGTPVAVAIGGALCMNAVVVDGVTITAKTTAHLAYDTFLADVVVTADDGQSAALIAGFTFTTP
jgi:hypothetical protein